MSAVGLRFGPSPEMLARKERLKGLSHRELCELLHATLHKVNGIIEKGFNQTVDDLPVKRDGEQMIRLIGQELKARNLPYVPPYEALHRVTLTETGEVLDVWVPYHAARPHPNFPSGKPTRNDLISNYHELERSLEAIRPGLSKEPRTGKFVTTRRRAS